MEKYLVIFFGLIFLIAPTVSAHSPSGISLTYNETTNELSVTVSHSVSDVTTHHINKIEVWKNDILNITEEYTEQTSATQHSDTFVIVVETDDTLKVKATCSISGSITDEITITEDTDTNGTDGTETTLSPFLINIPLIAITVYVIKRKKQN